MQNTIDIMHIKISIDHHYIVQY